MHEEGLQSSTFWGISGPLWRTGDIIVAQWMLARTFGHAVGASHWVTKGKHMLLATHNFRPRLSKLLSQQHLSSQHSTAQRSAAQHSIILATDTLQKNTWLGAQPFALSVTRCCHTTPSSIILAMTNCIQHAFTYQHSCLCCSADKHSVPCCVRLLLLDGKRAAAHAQHHAHAVGCPASNTSSQAFSGRR